MYNGWYTLCFTMLHTSLLFFILRSPNIIPPPHYKWTHHFVYFPHARKKMAKSSDVVRLYCKASCFLLTLDNTCCCIRCLSITFSAFWDCLVSCACAFCCWISWQMFIASAAAAASEVAHDGGCSQLGALSSGRTCRQRDAVPILDRMYSSCFEVARTMPEASFITGQSTRKASLWDSFS